MKATVYIATSDRLLQEKTKHELAARTWQHTQNYVDAKSEIVQEILARAPQLRKNVTAYPPGGWSGAMIASSKVTVASLVNLREDA